ncbi:hypothetical protein KKD19_04620 [Patescibacteria group bacterium]|nr:hypothetical protein [Patescibacteria group bacterium]MBU4512492.1 hypothetical protein [Patescibacteria group bacterium]MCG2692802.1 hypothetical protein [Candidatus Parcubacteria bacterium]
MTFRDNSGGNFPPRRMVQGNWTCSDCGKKITELPFEPSPDSPVYCRECWLKKRDQRSDRPRRMVRGNWTCSGCDKEITELPFEPSPNAPIYCKECWLKRKNQGA